MKNTTPAAATSKRAATAGSQNHIGLAGFVTLSVSTRFGSISPEAPDMVECCLGIAARALAGAMVGATPMASVMGSAATAFPLDGPAVVEPCQSASRALLRACNNSRGEPRRSAGDFSMHRSTTSATAGDTPGLTVSSGGGASRMCLVSNCGVESAVKGGTPASIW